MTKIQHAYCITALLLLAGILITQLTICANTDSIDSSTHNLAYYQKDYSLELGHLDDIKENTSLIIREIDEKYTGVDYLSDIKSLLKKILAELEH